MPPTRSSGSASTIVDATADLACAFKPQIAHFAAHRAEAALEAVCNHIRDHYPGVPMLLDAKRGDIGSTAEFYATEAFGRYRADAVTYNPYLGTDAARPMLDHGAVIAHLPHEQPGQRRAAGSRRRRSPAVRAGRRAGGATVDRARRVRPGGRGDVAGAARRSAAIVGDLPILVPGVGTQGGDVAASVAAGATADGTGLLLSSSREILYASSGDDFAEAARAAAEATVARIAPPPEPVTPVVLVLARRRAKTEYRNSAARSDEPAVARTAGPRQAVDAVGAHPDRRAAVDVHLVVVEEHDPRR